MLFSFLPPPVRGILSLLMYLLNTIVLTVPLILFSLLKFILPFPRFITWLDRALIAIATLWMDINSLNTAWFCRIHWDVRGLDQLREQEWYLVISNHQSWVDILVLQTLLNRRIPMLKFFLKKELIWVPFLGLAWWALDFPFMKRYSPAFLKAHPHLKGRDLEITRKACEKFRRNPISVMNFVEGTRYTRKKAQRSPFTHLLSPRAGGIAFVLQALGDCLHHIIDVTIVYPGKTPTFWSYVCGKTRRIIVDFRVIRVDDRLRGDYFSDDAFQKTFREWLNQLWEDKDLRIQRMS